MDEIWTMIYSLSRAYFLPRLSFLIMMDEMSCSLLKEFQALDCRWERFVVGLRGMGGFLNKRTFFSFWMFKASLNISRFFEFQRRVFAHPATPRKLDLHYWLLYFFFSSIVWHLSSPRFFLFFWGHPYCEVFLPCFTTCGLDSLV